jgi:4-amino-4-deoxy-L-arabinose transferase-like glycosyltransferase
MIKHFRLNSLFSKYSPILILLIIWGFGIFFIHPIGNFPLNDDWVYAIATKHFYEKNEFYPIPWNATALLSNVIWGWGFVKLFGFSFESLRFSSLIASLIGSWGTYYLLLNLSKSKIISFLGALALLCNPIFFGLSYTFMTDIFCLAAIIMSLIFFIKSLKEKYKALNLFAATFFSIVATLSRQTSLIIPLAFFLTFIISSSKEKATNQIFLWCIPFVISLVSFVLLELVLKANGHLPLMSLNGLTYFSDFFFNPLKVLSHFPRRALPMLFYTGLFSLPILILINWREVKINKKKFGIILIIFALLNGLRLMPTAKNIISDYGMGPITIKDVYFLNINKPQEISSVFWFFVTIISLIGASLIAYLIPKIFKRTTKLESTKKKIVIFLLLILFGYFTFFLIFPFWDRYFLIFLPILWPIVYLIFLNKKIQTKKILISISLIILFLFYSVITTKDYFKFNSVRWDMLNDLVHNKKINTNEIDGGYEFNGLYNYSITLDPSNWWVINDKYTISFGPIDGYHIYKKIEYAHILPKYIQTLYLLEKDKNDL